MKKKIFKTVIIIILIAISFFILSLFTKSIIINYIYNKSINYIDFDKNFSINIYTENISSNDSTNKKSYIRYVQQIIKNNTLYTINFIPENPKTLNYDQNLMVSNTYNSATNEAHSFIINEKNEMSERPLPSFTSEYEMKYYIYNNITLNSQYNIFKMIAEIGIYNTILTLNNANISFSNNYIHIYLDKERHYTIDKDSFLPYKIETPYNNVLIEFSYN